MCNVNRRLEAASDIQVFLSAGIVNSQQSHIWHGLRQKINTMGWKMIISYLWRSKDNVENDKSVFYDTVRPPSDVYNESDTNKELSFSLSAHKKYGRGSPAFRRKGLLRRQG